MTKITVATYADIEEILKVTKQAFTLYQKELKGVAQVKALSESCEDIKFDIDNNFVYVAKVDDKVLGCIRVQKISDDIAYIYRFSVEPDEHNAGIGTELIEYAVNECILMGISAITLHTNSKYFKLARYYYGKQFFVHSTDLSKGYIRALFVKELNDKPFDLSPALKK